MLGAGALLSAVVISIASSVAGARPTQIQPGPTVQPGQVVTIGSWRDGLYIGPKPTGTLEQYINVPFMSSLRVKANMIEEFRVSAMVHCEDVESHQIFNRRFLSSHASLQTFLRIAPNGKAEARVPMTDSFRWMEAWIKVDFSGDKGKVWVQLKSIRDPNSRDPLIEECLTVGQTEIVHTPATRQTSPFPGFN